MSSSYEDVEGDLFNFPAHDLSDFVSYESFPHSFCSGSLLGQLFSNTLGINLPQDSWSLCLLYLPFICMSPAFTPFRCLFKCRLLRKVILILNLCKAKHLQWHFMYCFFPGHLSFFNMPYFVFMCYCPLSVSLMEDLCDFVIVYLVLWVILII